MKILLHLCCANCGTVPIELLKKDFKIVLYWFNPNIQPEQEYQKRLKDAEKLAQIYKLKLIKESYHPEKWFKQIKGLEKEPEGGKRCQICFKMRLSKTAQTATEKNFDYFATTLTIGPQKKAVTINKIGQELAEKYNLEFYSADFKKKDGFKKSVELSKKYNFYRQNYCGCVFSMKTLKQKTENKKHENIKTFEHWNMD
jgi:predicted adenine nucleotide alpha hydrolase (AANH) superfamily ATPase